MVCMVLAGIRQQARRQTRARPFVWNRDLAQLLLNCAQTLLAAEAERATTRTRDTDGSHYRHC